MKINFGHDGISVNIRLTGLTEVENALLGAIAEGDVEVSAYDTDENDNGTVTLYITAK